MRLVAIDTRACSRCFRRVSFFRRITVVLLLAVWFAASQHCGLEAAGMWQEGAGSDHSCCAETTPCAQDGCSVVEGGALRSAVCTTKVFPPALHDFVLATCLDSLAQQIAARPTARWADEWMRGREWVPMRHFERRAAPPSRAPSMG